MYNGEIKKINIYFNQKNVFSIHAKEYYFGN
jgi:hypothetical protein